MAKSAKSVSVVEGTSMEALVKEGKALASIWNQTNSLKNSTKPNGFDTRLGKLLVELKAQSSLDSGQVSRQTLTTYGIHTIDRRRRAEALWFVENEVECRDFMKASKKGFTSLSALQKAMNAAAKAEQEPNQPAKAEPSDDGQSDDKPTKLVQHSETKVSVPITRSMMVNTIIEQCKANGLELEQIIDDLISKVALQHETEDR